MRCPPGLVFDDVYQRCEWPGAGAPIINQRLGSLRDKKSDDLNRTSLRNANVKVKQLRLMNTLKANDHSSSTFVPSTSSPSTTTPSTSTKVSTKMLAQNATQVAEP